VGVTVVVHEIGDTTDATAEDLMDLAEGWLGEYDDDPACRSDFSDRMPYPSPALPDYWVL
jgi:hypothetical protein